MYSSTLSFMCSFPKLARDTESHLALTSWQLWNCGDNKCSVTKTKVVISDDSNSLSLINNKMPLCMLMLKSSVIWWHEQITLGAKPRLSGAHANQLFSADSNLLNFSQKSHAF